jgi:predicted AlkP superfamily phosphohydrolase/phosphomutase
MRAAIEGAFSLPSRPSSRHIRNAGVIFSILVLAACSHGPQLALAPPKVIVLGMDGMDPGFLERHWSDLPNLDHLRRLGEFKRLATVMPPQSPVAWSTFITGMDPGGHGVFDFIHRNPDTRAPFSSMGEAIGPPWVLPLGPYVLPLSKGKIETFRQGTAFWDVLAQRGLPITILRMPMNFPPTADHDEELSGMGTPDLRGTNGIYTFYTDTPGVSAHDTGAGRFVPVRLEGNRATLRLGGPPNSLRRDGAETSVEIPVEVDPDSRVARFTAQGRQFVLAEGEWSGWIHIRFPLAFGLSGPAGIFRVYAKQLHDGFQVYISPVNLDPEDPAMPITNPPELGRELVRAVGPFYTQGMPEDTAALREGVFTLNDYLAQSREVAREHLRILRYAVEHAHGGLLFFHFFATDQDSHMLWGKHEPELLDTYRMVDETVGWVAERAPQALLIVMSDHGFTNFDRALNVNRWLVEQGLMTLQDPSADSGEGFQNVDWSRTKAYAVGLNGIYLNQAERETGGIVEPLEADAIIAAIREGLKALRDPENGAPVVQDVYQASQIYHGTHQRYAPDLLVGYRPPYRASWETVLGGTPRGIVVPNRDAWIGDHCIDPQFVPGVLISNRRSDVADPSLADMPVTLLKEFGVQPLPQMAGRAIYDQSHAPQLGENHVQ